MDSYFIRNKQGQTEIELQSKPNKLFESLIITVLSKSYLHIFWHMKKGMLKNCMTITYKSFTIESNLE